MVTNTDGHWRSLACFARLALLLCLPSAASRRLFRPSGFCPSPCFTRSALSMFCPFCLLHVLPVLPFFCPFKACSVANLLCLANLRVLTSASPAAVSTLSPSRPLYSLICCYNVPYDEIRLMCCEDSIQLSQLEGPYSLISTASCPPPSLLRKALRSLQLRSANALPTLARSLRQPREPTTPCLDVRPGMEGVWGTGAVVWLSSY